MTLTLPTPDLKAAVATCAKVAQPGHPTALSGIHLAPFGGDSLTITAGNFDLAITLEVEADGTNGADTLVPAKILADVVARCPGDTISLAMATDHLAVTSGRWKAKLPVLPAAEYEPYLARTTRPITDGEAATFDGDELMATVAQVAVCAHKDRTALTGVHFEPEGDGMRLVATDSYRLATRYLDGNQLAEAATVPAETLALVLAQHQAGEKLEVHTTRSTARFTLGRATITTNLVAEAFPGHWRHLIPDPAKVTGWLTVEEPGELAAAVGRNGRMFGGDLALVTLTLTTDGTAVIESATSDLGSSTEEVSGLTWTGPETAITFNGRYLADALNNFGGGPITAGAIDHLKPVVFRPAGSDHQSEDLHLLVPVKRPGT